MTIPAPDKNLVIVDRVVHAPAEAIFAILSDPTRHGEIDGSGTLRKPGETPSVLTLGSRFGMGMHQGVGYEMVNTVVELEKDRVIAWQPRPKIALLAAVVGGRIWKYVLEPVDGGTKVTEIWDIRQEKGVHAFTRLLAGKTRTNMTATLDRLEKVLST